MRGWMRGWGGRAICCLWGEDSKKSGLMCYRRMVSAIYYAIKRSWVS